MRKSKSLSDNARLRTPSNAAAVGPADSDVLPPDGTPPNATAPVSAAPPQSAPSESTDAAADVSVLRASSSLSLDQCRAMEKLMCGQSMSDAARNAGVGRTTLYRWMNDDPEFRAAHNAWKRDTMTAAHSSVLALTEPAIRAVAGAVEAGDAKIGLTILKSMGLLSPPTSGSTSADDVRKEQEIKQKQREKELLAAEADADFPV